MQFRTQPMTVAIYEWNTNLLTVVQHALYTVYLFCIALWDTVFYTVCSDAYCTIKQVLLDNSGVYVYIKLMYYTYYILHKK